MQWEKNHGFKSLSNVLSSLCNRFYPSTEKIKFLSTCLGSPDEIESNLTNTSCGCPQVVLVDQCDCNYRYGRKGYECHFDHPRPIEGQCSENDVAPVHCGDKCSRQSMLSFLSIYRLTLCRKGLKTTITLDLTNYFFQISAH